MSRDEREKLAERCKRVTDNPSWVWSNLDLQKLLGECEVALRTPADGEALEEIQRLQDAKRRALALADERAKENVALILAAQAVVHDYPVAAGTARWDTEGGYGSIRDLRLALDTLSTAPEPANTPDEGPDPLGYAKGEHCE